MKTKGVKKTKVNIVTLGCSKNLVDSEVLLTQLRGNGINAVHESSEDDSSVVVINTCGFIDNANRSLLTRFYAMWMPKKKVLLIKSL